MPRVLCSSALACPRDAFGKPERPPCLGQLFRIHYSRTAATLAIAIVRTIANYSDPYMTCCDLLECLSLLSLPAASAQNNSAPNAGARKAYS